MGHPSGMIATAIFFLFALNLTNAATGKCNVGCRGMQSGKGYQEGHTYVYDLEGKSVTSVSEAQGEAVLRLKATVELSVKPDCIKQLRLKGVQLNGAPIASADVEGHAIQFNYHNGHVDTELCAEEGDSQASLNIKRAVVSLFQSAVLQDSGSTTHHETDIFGGCPTDFTFHKEGDSLVVQKYRNLGQCSYRENINQGLVTANFDTASDIKSTPLLSSNQKIEQRFKRGILNKAASTETYKYKPFSNGDAGAKTVIETTLTLKSEKGDSPTAPVSTPKSVIFEAPHPVIESSVDSIVSALKSAKGEVADEVKRDAAVKFSALVKVLRTSNKADLLAVYQKIRSGSGFDKVKDSKLFLDALFHAGSGEAAEVAVDLVKSGEVSGVQALIFYARLAFIGHVNLPSVTAVTSLLDQPSLPRIAYLGIGHVIGKYCQQHACENVPEVKEALHKIRDKVGNGKAKTRDQENLIVSALKALGNTEFLDDATLQKVANIASDKTVRNRVRVAAIETLPAKCSSKWKTPLFKVLADIEEDSEIRIKTYLSLVSCACPAVANQLKEVLDNEKVNQVGSFIQSHLRHLRASTDPNKQEAKKQLGLIKPRTKFPEDFRKFSFNNELSYHLDAFGLGSAVETNVIYSQNSFVPRSANLNLTAELFGRNFNFLELNSRVENLDRLLEHYFGPKGEISTYDVQEFPGDTVSKTIDITGYIKQKVQKLRGKRDVKQGELDRFAKNVKLRGNEVNEDLDVDISLKLFGVEFGDLSYQGDASKLNYGYIIDKIFAGLEKGVEKAKNFQYDLKNNLQFLDGELIYPTGLGAPLSLGVTGTSVIRLKTSGKVDISAILDDPKNAALRLDLAPSAAITITGNLLVESFGVEAGLKLVSTLHTDTATTASVTLLNGKGIDLNFGSPQKKEVLISLTSDLLVSSGPKGDVYVAPKFGKAKEYSDCFDQFGTFIGITPCWHVNFPYESVESLQKKPFFPLSGPAKVEVNVDNNDMHNIHFKAYYNTEKPNARSLEVTLDTPNTKINRRISLNLEGGLEPNKYVKVSLDSPFKKASLEGIIKNNEKERTITLTLDHDGLEYFLKTGILASGSKYKPVLEYKIPEHIERLSGGKSGKGSQQYNVEGTVDVVNHQDGKKFVFDKVAFLVSERKMFGLDGEVVSTPNLLGVDVKVGYGDESLALKLDGKRFEERNYEIELSAVPSRDPNIGFNVKWDWKRTNSEWDHKLVFVHGADPKSEVNRLTLDQKYVYKTDPKDLVLSGSNKLSYAALDLLVKLAGEVTRNSVSGDAEFKYLKFKVGSELSAKVNNEKPGDFEVEFEAELLENAIEVKSKRTIVDSHKSKFENSVELKPGGKYELDATVTYDVAKHNINVHLDGDLNLNGKKVKVDTGLQSNPQAVNSNALVKIDGTKYVDFILKVRRGANPNGNLILNLKDYLTANGQFNYQGGKGTGNVNIDIPKINRKVKATGDLAITGTQHVGTLEVLYDAERDPTRKIKLSTVSDISKNAVDTKNVIEVLSYKLEANGKGSLQGTLQDGQLNADIDLTLPNGRYLTYHIKRSSIKKGKKYDMNVEWELADHVKKGGEARKLSHTAQANDADFTDTTFDATGQIKFVNFDSKDAKFAWKGKSTLDGKKRTADLEIDVSGACVPKVLKGQFNLVKDVDSGSYHAKTSLGDDWTSQGNFEYVFPNDGTKPTVLKYSWDGRLPWEKLRNFKVEHTSSGLRPSVQGGGEYDYTTSSKLTYNGDKTIKVEGQAKAVNYAHLEEPSEGNGKVTLTILKNPPLTIGGTYKVDPTGEKKKSAHTLNVKYGDKEATVATEAEYLRDLSFIKLDAKTTLPFEKISKFDVQLNHKTENDGQVRKTDVTINTDDEKYTALSDIQLTEGSKKVHILFSAPKSKAEIRIETDKRGEYKGEWKVHTPQGYVDADAVLNLENLDNFIISGNFDSDKITPSKIHAEIANKPTAKNGKRIVITVTSDGKNIVTGSTSYKRRDEDGKIVVEGNGSLTIGEKVRSSSFKYTKQELTRETDGEIGVAIVLNANFGPSAIVGELKLSNKEIHVFNSYCEQNKDCAHFKVQSTLDTDHKTHFKHQSTLEVDLKKFAVPAEFGLKTNTEYKNFIFGHTASLYLHSSKDKSEYSYQVYAHSGDSGIILTLPSREVAFIVTFNLPKTKQTGAFKLDSSLYLDRKNKPNEKTSLTATGDITIDKNSLSLTGETKFVYPTQPKDLSVKGHIHYSTERPLDASVDIDVFAKKSQKITITANVGRQALENGFNTTSVIELVSKGQHLKLDLKSHLALTTKSFGLGSFFTYNDVHQKPKNLGALFSADLKRVFFLLVSPNQELLRSETKLDLSKENQKVDTELAILGNKPTVFNYEANGLNSFSYSQYNLEHPNNKLTASGRVIFGQLAEIHADAFKEGTKKNLFHVLVHLDEGKFLKPDFGYSKENVLELVEYMKNVNIQRLKQLKDISADIGDESKREFSDLFDHLKKAQPNVKPLLDYYQGELTKLKNELHADETVKEIQATLNKHFGAIVKAFATVAKQVAERLTELQKEYVELTGKLTDVAKSVYPQLKSTYETIVRAVISVSEAFANLFLAYFNAALTVLNQHQKELKELATVVADFAQDIAKIVFRSIGQLKHDVEEFVTILVTQLKALPVYETLKEKYSELSGYQVPEAILGPIQEICNIVKAALPTEPMREFFEASCQYVLKHIRREKVDEATEIKKIYTLAVNAVYSVFSLLHSQANVDNIYGFLQTKIPIDLSLLAQLPGFATLKLSAVNLLRNGDIPSPTDLYYTYRPTVRLGDIIPPFSMFGRIVDGGHFFTFDGRHFTMPGTCNYVLAQDIENGNFSIIGNFNNGNLASITVTEPKGSVTVNSNGNVLVNNKPADFPADTKNVHGFLRNGLSVIKSDYGATVACAHQSGLICFVEISGFYLGKVRGLLGDGNNEPYDDFTLPNGKITESDTEFGNAYKLKADCPAATAVEHGKTPRAPICTEYFSGESTSFKSCFNYVSPLHYRDACDHAVAAGTKNAACLIAGAYFSACYEKRIHVNIPSVCSTCKVGTNEIAIGDAFSVKIPKKEADVIFVVEQDSHIEKVFKDLVQPVMNDLRDELKHHGITDVHIGLIGFGEKISSPQHYTLNGNRNIEGEVKNMKFEEKDPIITLQGAKEGDVETRLTYLGQRLDVELGTFKLTDAYEEAIRYPFRPGAAKAVVGVIGEPCEKSPLPLSLQHIRLLLGQKIYKDLGLTYFHVSSPGDTLASGKAQKNIVGYDYDSAYTFADAKKKPFAGNSDLKNNLVVATHDVCADFAISSGGAAFFSNNFLDAKPNQKKQFIQVTAKRIAEGLTNVELEEDCVCVQELGAFGNSRCKIVGRKEKEHLAKHSKGGKIRK